MNNTSKLKVPIHTHGRGSVRVGAAWAAQYNQPTHHACASTECLLMGANANLDHPQVKAELQRRQDVLLAAGVIASAPALMAAAATPQGQVALQALLFNRTSMAAGSSGAAANASSQYAQKGSVDLTEVGVSAVTGAVTGGATIAIRGATESTRIIHGVALSTTVGVNAAGAAVTGGEQGPTAAGSIAGYGAGLIPSPWGALAGAFAQEIVTRGLNVQPPSEAAQRPTRGGQ